MTVHHMFHIAQYSDMQLLLHNNALEACTKCFVFASHHSQTHSPELLWLLSCSSSIKYRTDDQTWSVVDMDSQGSLVTRSEQDWK